MNQTDVDEAQRIIVSEGGNEYTLPFTWTETSTPLVDVSSLDVTTSLGDDDFPGDVWTVPERLTNPAVNKIRFQMKIDDSVDVGAYWTYIKIVTPDETIIRRCAKLIVA